MSCGTFRSFEPFVSTSKQGSAIPSWRVTSLISRLSDILSEIVWRTETFSEENLCHWFQWSMLLVVGTQQSCGASRLQVIMARKLSNNVSEDIINPFLHTVLLYCVFPYFSGSRSGVWGPPGVLEGGPLRKGGQFIFTLKSPISNRAT